MIRLIVDIDVTPAGVGIHLIPEDHQTPDQSENCKAAEAGIATMISKRVQTVNELVLKSIRETRPDAQSVRVDTKLGDPETPFIEGLKQRLKGGNDDRTIA